MIAFAPLRIVECERSLTCDSVVILPHKLRLMPSAPVTCWVYVDGTAPQSARCNLFTDEISTVVGSGNTIRSITQGQQVISGAEATVRRYAFNKTFVQMDFLKTHSPNSVENMLVSSERCEVVIRYDVYIRTLVKTLAELADFARNRDDLKQIIRQSYEIYPHGRTDKSERWADEQTKVAERCSLLPGDVVPWDTNGACGTFRINKVLGERNLFQVDVSCMAENPYELTPGSILCRTSAEGDGFLPLAEIVSM